MDKKFASGLRLLTLSLFLVCQAVATPGPDPVKGTMDITSQNIHLQQVPFLSYRMNTDVPAVPQRGRSTESLSELTITKEVDRSSALLTKFVTTGDKLAEVKLRLYKADDHSKYALITLTQATIVKINRVQAASPNGARQPMREREELTFHFAAVRIDYNSAATNTTINGKWDIQKASKEK
jgi:type VI secretion system Hcp family effector